jgi:hypothetical protein
MRSPINSIAVIFKKFTENSVKLENVKVVVLGGWEDSKISTFSCAIVIQKIYAAGFQNVSTKNMFSKKSAPNGKYPDSESSLYYHFGAQVDARTGNTYILKKIQIELSIEQRRQIQHLLKQSKKSDLPITQVT